MITASVYAGYKGKYQRKIPAYSYFSKHFNKEISISAHSRTYFKVKGRRFDFYSKDGDMVWAAVKKAIDGKYMPKKKHTRVKAEDFLHSPEIYGTQGEEDIFDVDSP